MTDYEAKYKNALERMRKSVESGTIDQVQAELVFDEFKESEDERIRSGLIRYLESDRDCQPCQDISFYEEAIAWLEKQKEQKPVECIVPPPSDPFMFNLRSIIYNFGKQIAAECLNTHILDTELDEYVTDANVDKYIKEHVSCLVKYHPLQKPAEWSEEDEKRIKQLIYDTEHIRAEYEKKKEKLGENFNNSLIKDCDEQISWLKSLRPQPQGTYKLIVHNIYEMLKDKDFFDITPSHRASLLNDIRVRCKNADEQAEILDKPQSV